MTKVSLLLVRSPLLVTRNEWTLRYLAYKDVIERAHSRRLNPNFYLKQGTMAFKFFNRFVKRNGLVRLSNSRRLKNVPPPASLSSSSEGNSVVDSQNIAGTAIIQRGQVRRQNFMFKYPISYNELQRSEIQQHQRIASASIGAEDLDHTKLDNSSRLPEETLYLLLKDNSNGGSYQLPSLTLEKEDFLHTAADKLLENTCGEAAHHWRVGKIPIAHHQDNFYMKARYLGGVICKNKHIEHHWLTRQEILNDKKITDLSESLARIL